MFKSQGKENNRCTPKQQITVFRLLERCRQRSKEKLMNSIFQAFEQVMVKIDPQNVMSTAIRLVRHSLLIKNNSQVIGSKDHKDKQKKKKERNVAECKTDSDEDTDGGGHVLVSEEHA